MVGRGPKIRGGEHTHQGRHSRGVAVGVVIANVHGNSFVHAFGAGSAFVYSKDSLNSIFATLAQDI